MTPVSRVTPAVRLCNVSKRFRLGESHDSLRDLLTAAWARWRKSPRKSRPFTQSRAQRALDNLGDIPTDEAVGASIIRRSLEQPLRLIVENSGFEGSVVLNEVKQQADDYGFGADLGEYGPMLERGIVDPTKVTRSAL